MTPRQSGKALSAQRRTPGPDGPSARPALRLVDSTDAPDDPSIEAGFSVSSYKAEDVAELLRLAHALRDTACEWQRAANDSLKLAERYKTERDALRGELALAEARTEVGR